MINAKKGIVKIDGTECEIKADVTLILKTVKKVLKDKHGTEKAKKDMEEIVNVSKLSEEEIKEELKWEIFKALFGKK